jgi:hypothetical protein
MVFPMDHTNVRHRHVTDIYDYTESGTDLVWGQWGQATPLASTRVLYF